MIVADWSTLQRSAIFLFLIDFFFLDLSAGFQTCYIGMQADGLWRFPPFSPEGLSGFSISGELEDRVFLQVIRKPVERGEAKVSVIVNPLQESC